MKLQLAFFGILLVTIGHTKGSSSTMIATNSLNGTVAVITAATYHTLKTPIVTSTAAPHPVNTTVGPTKRTTVPTLATDTTHAAPATGRKFDASSFVGGIVLGMVFVFLGLWAYKWYEKRNRSYHSL